MPSSKNQCNIRGKGTQFGPKLVYNVHRYIYKEWIGPEKMPGIGVGAKPQVDSTRRGRFSVVAITVLRSGHARGLCSFASPGRTGGFKGAVRMGACGGAPLPYGRGSIVALQRAAVAGVDLRFIYAEPG